MNKEPWQVEWLVASLAPWTISPHPNFREQYIGGPARLALVVEMRENKETKRASSTVAPDFDWAERLVRCASASLRVEMQEESARDLVALSSDRHLPPGARAASALFASVALCELDNHDEAISLLSEIIDEWSPPHSSRETFMPSQRLIVSALRLQLATRLTERSRFTEAMDSVISALYWVPKINDRSFQSFSVSRGISWGSATVQRDITRSIKNNSLSLRAYIEYMGGDTWSRVVKSRTSWVDWRARSKAAERDELVLRDAFEMRIEATSNVRHFGRTTAEAAGYRALLLAELSGQLSRMRSERESLGKVLLLGQYTDAERIREALRLLRQSRATKPLRSAIAFVRSEGPSEALVTDAEVVVERAGRTGWCSEQDLLVLEGAADFLTEEQKNDAIVAALKFRETPQLPGALSLASWERLWKAITKLVHGSTSHDKVSDAAYEQLASTPELSQPLANTLARLVDSVDWKYASSTSREKWLVWAEGENRTPDNSALLDSIDENVANNSRVMPLDVGMEKAVYLAAMGSPASLTNYDLNQVERFLVSTLEEDAADAKKGTMSFGNYQTLDVASAFAIRFQSEIVWDQVVDNILDPTIDVALKDAAVDRIAYHLSDVPSTHTKRLYSGISDVINSRRSKSFFGNSGSSVFAEALRLGAALEAVPPDDLLDTILKLSTSDAKDRVQAAKIIPFCITAGEATWGHALLLQLSHDNDPHVRAAAGASLVESVMTRSPLTEAVYARILSMLKSDGVKTPLAILHSVQRASRHTGSDLLDPLKGQIEALTDTEGNYLVRGAASFAKRIMEEPGLSN